MSKELEALKELGNYRVNDIDYCVKDTIEYDIIENALKRLEVYDKCNYQTTIHKDVLQISKELEALNIIKEIFPIEEEDFCYDKQTDTYIFLGYKVSKEEYDLLKEVLYSNNTNEDLINNTFELD